MSCNEQPIKICAQTNIPKVDNAAIECAECGFIDSNCVIFKNAIAYLGLSENTSIEEVLKAIMISLINIRNRVTELENN